MPVLLPLALPAPYDYAVPEGMAAAPGQYVVVPLWTVDISAWSGRARKRRAPTLDPNKLREIVEVVDECRRCRACRSTSPIGWPNTH